MPHAPRIHQEPSSFTGRGGMAADGTFRGDGDEQATGVRSGPRAEVSSDLSNPGWFGDLRQNLTNHWMVQQR